MSLWCPEKVIAALKLVVHPEILPTISKQDDLNFRKSDKKFVAHKFLDFVYEKSNKKLEIYGNVDEMFDIIHAIDRIPNFLQFSVVDGGKLSEYVCRIATTNKYLCIDGNSRRKWLSKVDVVFCIHQRIMTHVTKCAYGRLVEDMFFTWMAVLLNRQLPILEGTYELIEFALAAPIFEEIDRIFECFSTLKEFKTSKTPCFSNFREYFDQEEWVIFNYYNKEPVETYEKIVYRNILSQLFYIIESSQKIFPRYPELLTPFSQLSTAKLEQPCVRFINGDLNEYFLAKEVDNAVNVILKSRPKSEVSKNDLPKIALETEEERKLGIVYTIHKTEMMEIANKLNNEFIILSARYEQDFSLNILPIISSYGTHCVPAETAFNKILYYLTVILRVFQRSTSDNLKEVFKWISDSIGTLFQPKPMFYLVETWQIDKIIDRARKELSKYLTEPEYEVPYQREYQKNEVVREVDNLTKNIGMDRKFYMASFNQALFACSTGAYRLRNIFDMYDMIIRFYIFKSDEKIQKFELSQLNSKIVKTGETEVLKRVFGEYDEKKRMNTEESLTGFKRGFLNKKQDQPKKQDMNIVEPTNQESPIEIETKNDEINIKKLQEKLEKLEKENLQLRKDSEMESKASTSKIEKIEEDLKKEKNRVKNYENEFQLVRRKLEKSNEELCSLSKRSEIQLNASTSEIEKMEEKLQKWKETTTQLTERLETEEKRHSVEVRSLKTTNENLEKGITVIKNQSDMLKIDNQNLLGTIDTLKKEIEELDVKNMKNAECHQKIKEFQNTLEIKHSNLVDSASSRLKSMDSQNFKEVIREIEMLEVVVDVYMESVENELEKL